MPFGAYYVQAACGDDGLMLPVGILLYPLVGLAVYGPCLRYALVVRFLVARGSLYQKLVHAVLPKLALGQELRIAAKQYIRASSGHVRGYGHRAEAAGLRHYLRLPGVQLCVQHLVLYAALGEHIAQQLALFHRYRTYEYGLARSVYLHYLVNNGAELAMLRAVYYVVIVYSP